MKKSFENPWKLEVYKKNLKEKIVEEDLSKTT